MGLAYRLVAPMLEQNKFPRSYVLQIVLVKLDPNGIWRKEDS